MQEIKTDAVIIIDKRDHKDRWDFSVGVAGEEGALEYSVSLEKGYWNKLTGGQVEPEKLIRASFSFLLEREPERAILRKFNLWEINEYFPEYEKEIKKLLGVETWTVSFDDFAKLDLRIAKVLESVHVEGSDKLLRLEVDIGGEKRQIIAGIAQHYDPKELIGREVVVVVNLEPRVLMGLESQGMLLAANDEGDRPVLLQPEKEVSPGTRIR